MTNSANKANIPATAGQAPPVIPLPKIERPHAGTSCPPSGVRSPQDLPDRLFLGSLDPSSFRAVDDGWKVQYVDDDGETTVTLGYERDDNRLIMFQTWRGEWGAGCTVGSDDFRHLARNTIGFPGIWDDRAKKLLESEYNMQYLPTQEEAHVVTGFPDGAFKSLCCPVPVSRLRNLVACHRDMAADTSIKAPISGYIHLGIGAVNYLEGRNGPSTSDPALLYWHTFDQTGLPAIDMPVWETGRDGTRALTVKRLIYVYVVTFPFREINRLASSLHRYGIIGSVKAGEPAETPPHAPEFAAVILQAGLEVLPIEFNYFDRQGTRRTYYERFSDLEAMISLVEEPGIDEIERLVGCAEEASAEVASSYEEIFSSHQTDGLQSESTLNPNR